MELTEQYFVDGGYTCNHPEKTLKTYRKSGKTWNLAIEEHFIPATDRVVYFMSLIIFDDTLVKSEVSVKGIRSVEELENCLNIFDYEKD